MEIKENTINNRISHAKSDSQGGAMFISVLDGENLYTLCKYLVDECPVNGEDYDIRLKMCGKNKNELFYLMSGMGWLHQFDPKNDNSKVDVYFPGTNCSIILDNSYSYQEISIQWSKNKNKPALSKADIERLDKIIHTNGK